MKSIFYFLCALCFVALAEDNKPTLRKNFADKGVFEIGGRAELSYRSTERGAGLGNEAQGSLYLAPQMGYFLTQSFEISLFPTLGVNFYDNRPTETSYGAMLSPAYILPYLRPFYPYVEGLVGSSLGKTNQTLSLGAGVGLKIVILENALLKIGFTYLNNDKRSRVDSSVYEVENTLNFSLGFGIFL
ncbi:MAG: hypothetical protein LDLANPLL_02176 [Turneriella sp.]|nr:hypothetical protein [Turneriella sp.]